MHRFAHARGVRRLGALLLLLVLLPGWTLPPECAACPHGAESHATAPEHGAEEHTAADAHAHAEAVPHGATGVHAAMPAIHEGAPTQHDDSPAHHDDDCGCPCDVQCAPVQIAIPATIEVPSGDTPDAPALRLTPTRIRPAAPPFPPHFLPLSNAPPR